MSSNPLSTSSILRFYIPLALSWLFMAIESPISVGIISRLSDPAINTAAFQFVLALSLWIESPVIDLLSTSTTLAKNQQHYLVLRRFVVWLMIWVTVVHAAIALTPLYDLIVRHPMLLNLPQSVADVGRPAMIIMIPWSAFIGWRRYHQGILIRHGQTRLVGTGTLVRMSTMAVVGLTLWFFKVLPGVQVVSVALICSVGAEAIFAHMACRQTITEKVLPSTEASDQNLTVKQLLRFHMPLTATTMVMFLGNPLITAAISRSPNSLEDLAAWQVCVSLLFLHRTIVYALPEVVITLQRHPGAAKKLSRFCMSVGLGASGVALLFGLLGIDRVFFVTILRADESIAQLAHQAFLWGAPLPLIGALQSYVRGMLTSHHLTVARLYAVFVSIGSFMLFLSIGVAMKLPGVVNAPVSLLASQVIELLVLWVAWHRGSAKLNAIAAGSKVPQGSAG